jgi:hypothetical protein
MPVRLSSQRAYRRPFFIQTPVSKRLSFKEESFSIIFLFRNSIPPACPLLWQRMLRPPAWPDLLFGGEGVLLIHIFRDGCRENVMQNAAY